MGSSSLDTSAFRRRRKNGRDSTPTLDVSERLCHTSLMNESVIRTISIKMDVDGHEAKLQETQQAFNAAASWIASICWEEHITNSNTAHHRVYGETRTHFGLGAQLAVCARAKAVEAVKAARTQEKQRNPDEKPITCPGFGPRGSIRYDARSFHLKSLDRVSLLTLQGRITCRLLPGMRQHTMLTDPTWKIGGADLVWRRGTYYLNITQSKDAPELTRTDETLGIDLGLVNLATDSTGETFNGAKVHEVRTRYQKRRSELQRVGTRSAKRRLKKLSGREKRFQKNTNHKISKSLVHKAVQSRKALALEDLTGIRERTTVRRENRYERHSWAFFQLRMYIAYKAAWAGIEVKFVDPHNTSRTCSQCGHCAKANRQSQASFRCKQCGFCCNADYNAALNISRAPVKVPLVASVRG
jgi:putative transposase